MKSLNGYLLPNVMETFGVTAFFDFQIRFWEIVVRSESPLPSTDCAQSMPLNTSILCLLILCRDTGGLETGRGMGYTLDVSSVYLRADTETDSPPEGNSEFPVRLTCMCLDCEGWGAHAGTVSI